jgi:cytochrome c oxidase subunit IV
MADTHTAHEEHSTRFYWLIGAFLAIITVVEVVVAVVGLPAIPLLVILLVLSLVKGACVVMFFMHLRGDARVFQFLFVAPFLIATSMLIAFLALFSGHVGLGG